MKKLRRAAALCAAATPALVRDLAGFAGTASIAYGAWQIYVPAGWIAGGVLLLALVLLSARQA